MSRTWRGAERDSETKGCEGIRGGCDFWFTVARHGSNNGVPTDSKAPGSSTLAASNACWSLSRHQEACR
jgi:hypothetical protein